MKVVSYTLVTVLALTLSACSGMSTRSPAGGSGAEIPSATGGVIRSSRQNPDILTKVLSMAGPGKVVLFDLDDTLIDCQPRSYHLILDFLDLPGTQTTYPDLVAKVKTQLKVENIGFSVPSTQLWAIGIRKDDERTITFLNALDAYWLAHLQANESFINFDVANPGAVQYVNAIHDRGATVVYFSGRPEAISKSGTISSLTKLGFPMDDHAFPVLKGSGNFTGDADFKGKTAPLINNQFGKIIAFFDNEPANDLAVRASMPSIDVIFVNTSWQGTDMGKLVSNPTIFWINNFIIPEAAAPQ